MVMPLRTKRQTASAQRVSLRSPRQPIPFSMDRHQPRILQVGQLNLQGSAAATKELLVIARSLGLDIVLVQEQYAATAGILQCGEHPAAGIVVVNPRLAVTVLDELSSSHCLVAHIVHGNDSFHLVSAYFQYSHDVAIHVSGMERVLNKLGDSRVLVGVDSNAHSPMWHSEWRQRTDRGHDAVRRRTLVEGIILERDLIVHNVAGQPHTFHGPNGKSNVDITLSTRGLSVRDWRVHAGASLSDHQLITFSVLTPASTPSAARAADDLPVRFRDRGVDWDLFCSTLSARMDQLHSNMSAADYCKRYSEILLRTATECLGKCSRTKSEKYEWWSPSLDALRLQVGRARRKWQGSRSQGGDTEERLHDDLRAKRIEYKHAMREAEMEFYVQLAESGNEDPWGVAYREASGRRRPPSNVISGLKLAEGYTMKTGDTMAGLVGALCPDDDPGKDTPYHREVRCAAAIAPSGSDALAPSIDAVERIIRSLPNTAPGFDGVTSRIVKWAWKATGAEMYLMFSKCVAEGVFPDCWKLGQLIVLPKGNSKPLSDPKAYRPITLLPILGKVLERVLLSCSPCLTRGVAEGQHGFCRGRSTSTALLRLNEIIDNSAEKYVQLIFLDISGAFDNAWWPMILLKAKQWSIAPNIYRLLVSYFTDRTVTLVAGDQRASKRSTMGCPQGSVLGPTLWNLLLNDILLLPFPEGVTLIAYADDVTVVIEASSRAQIERKAGSALEAIAEWGGRNRLSFSPAKSMTMTCKGQFARAPTIRMDGASIASVAQARVLGITLDHARSYIPHAKVIGESAANCFGKMSRVSTTRWGLRYRALRMLYRGTYVSVLTYAAGVWYHRWSTFAVKRRLLSTQRSSLCLLTKAYRSCSTAALPVLAGTLPADLEVLRVGRFGEEIPGLAPREIRARRLSIVKEVVDLWQERWEGSENGRDLFRFFPSVGVRLDCYWVEPDYVVSQLLSGHGCFRSRLNAMTLCDSPLCPCEADVLEDRDHALWECALYAGPREVMLSGIHLLPRDYAGPVYHADLVSSPERFVALRKFAHEWHAIRRAYE